MTQINPPAGTYSRPSSLAVAADFVSRALRRQLHLPPWWLRDVGPSDFVATGLEFMGYFTGLAGLRPHERVLDIGCGCGRMALPLTKYLVSAGLYVGLDITPNPIMWCQQHITPRHPNFHFFHMDLYNRRYNPNGRHQASQYRFPLANQSFDFIFLTSVFTHLLPEDSRNYLQEISRLLAPGGRTLLTFFLLNETQQTLAQAGQNDIDFKFGEGVYRTRNETTPESAVAYDETYVRTLLEQSGLRLAQLHYGSWSGRADGLSYQDIIIAEPLPPQG